MKKRRLMAGLAGAVVAALLAGCGTSGATTPTANAEERKAGEKVQLTFWSWVPGVDKAVALWNSQNPDVQVKLEKIPNGSAGGYAKMYSALDAGSGAPDLAQVEYQEIPSFLLAGGLVDLSQYGADSVKDQFVDWQWNQTTYAGKTYAIPQASGPMAFFYRQDIFDSYGLKPPATWDEFAEDAKIIHQKNPNSYISAFPPGNSAWFTSLAWQAGANWFGTSGDDWTVNIDSPQTLKVAKYWDNLVSQDLIKVEPDFANGWYKDLQDGNIVGWVSAQWGDAILSQNAPKTAGDWRVAPMPQWDPAHPASANWGGSSTAVLTGTKYPKEAMDFAVWLNTNPQSIDLLINGGYGWPAAKGAFKGSALDQSYPFFGGQRTNDVFAESDAQVNTSWQWIPTTAASYQHLNDGFQAAVNGSGSFTQAVREAQKQTVQDMKAKGLPVKEKP